jgi:hypothetical protein
METLKKERIKDRMLKTTARLWGVPENEIETNFDPLILLMIDACSAEFEKLGYDLSASQTRLLDKLADLILPEALLGPLPSSCIMRATPLETVAKLEAETQFLSNHRLQRDGGTTYNTDIYFTSVGTFELHKAELKHMLIGDKLYSISENNARTLTHRGENEESSTVQDLWLAIAPDKAIPSLRGLSIYFDLRSHSEANSFYKSLESATGSANDNKVVLKKGYSDSQQFELGPEEMLISGQDYTRKIRRRIAAVYEKQFIHINDDQSLTKLTSSVPESWKGVVPDKALQQLATESLVYLKISLGRPFATEILDGLTCAINAFPTINRKFNTLTYRTDAWVNIIPMPIEGSFLDLQDISSSSGGQYKFRTASEKQTLEEGEATVRSSGIGKTNSKEVREIIGSLMDAIRDESAYFSELSNEFLLARLREVSQILARLEDQLAAAKDSRAPHHYVLLRPKQTGDQVTITYWTSSPEDANKVRAGSIMTPHNNTLVAAKSAVTLTNALGGKAGISEAEKKALLKQQLISKGKVTSAEDIRLLCFQLFGDKLKRAEVTKGIQIGTSKTDGFVRTVDVVLTLTPGLKDSRSEEISYLCNTLEYQLAQNAAPIYPFRVIVN